MDREHRIEEEVFAVLRTLTPRGTLIERHHKLLADLHLLSDDATAMALDLEREFHVKVPRSEWENVFTVQDVIELLCRHVKD